MYSRDYCSDCSCLKNKRAPTQTVSGPSAVSEYKEMYEKTERFVFKCNVARDICTLILIAIFQVNTNISVSPYTFLYFETTIGQSLCGFLVKDTT